MKQRDKPKSAAQRQQERRERVLRGPYGPREARLQVYVHKWAAEKLKEMAKEDGKTQRETIEKLITGEANRREIERAKTKEIVEKIKRDTVTKQNVTLSRKKAS